MTTRISSIRRYLAIEGLFPLILCEFLISAGIAFWSQLLSIHLKTIGFTVVGIGLRSTIQALLTALTLMPAGLISDRIGRRKLLIFSYGLTLLYVISLVFLRDFYAILLTTVLHGAALGIRNTVVSAYAADRVSPNNRGMAFASISFFQILARIVAIAGGSFIADAFGFVRVFQTSSIVSLTTVFLAAYLLQESLKAKQIEATVVERVSLYQSTLDALNLLKDRNMLLLMAGTIIHRVGMQTVAPFLSLYANVVLGFNLITVGFLLNARQVGDVVGQLPVGKLIDRFGGETAMFLHVFMTAPIIYFYSVTNNLFLVFIIFLIWGTELGWDMPSRRLLIIKYGKGVGTATALGSMQAVIAIAGLIAPTLGGWLWDTLGPASVFQVSAIYNMFASIPFLILMLKARRENRVP